MGISYHWEYHIIGNIILLGISYHWEYHITVNTPLDCMPTCWHELRSLDARDMKDFTISTCRRLNTMLNMYSKTMKRGSTAPELSIENRLHLKFPKALFASCFSLIERISELALSTTLEFKRLDFNWVRFCEENTQKTSERWIQYKSAACVNLHGYRYCSCNAKHKSQINGP